MTHREVIANIRQICNLSFDMDAEQVLDIILGRNDRKENKTVAYQEIVSQWGASEWKSVLKEFYTGFSKAKLCEIFLDEQDHNMRADSIAEAQRDMMQYKKAPDSYYLHLANLELTPPADTAPAGDEQKILCSLYAAIASGENYGTVAYPPQKFIDNVVQERISPSEYLATLMRLAEDETPLEQLASQAVAANKEMYKQMRAAYKKLVGTDLATTAGKVAATAATTAAVASVAAGKAGRKIKKATYVEPEGKQKKLKAPKEEKASVIDSTAIKSFGKWGIIMLVVNGAATASRLTFGMSGAFKLLGDKGMAGLLEMINATGINLLPAVGLACTVLMMFTGIVSNSSKGKTAAKFVMVLAMCCTAFSVYTLIKTLIAMIAAGIQSTFTIENIGEFIVTSPFKLLGGAFNGIKGLFGG